MNSKFVASATALVAFWTALAAAQSGPLPTHPVPAIFAADNGTFSGHAELEYIEKVFTTTVTLDVPECQSARFGNTTTGAGQVFMVYSGIGSVAAATCAQAILGKYAISMILWAGTSGVSSVVGGFEPHQASTGGCELPAKVQRLALGSSCVSSAALSLMCGQCGAGWEQLPQQCAVPPCDKQDDAGFVGACNFKLPKDLASEVLAAGRAASLPVMPASLQKHLNVWWSHNGAAADSSSLAPPTDVPTTPALTGNCAIASAANLIAPGAPLDYLCRSWSARLVGGEQTAANTACWQEMESAGLLQLLSAAHPDMPLAIVRGGSNYDHFPLQKLQTGAWTQNASFTGPAESLAMVKEGYAYAVHVTNAIVLAYMDSPDMAARRRQVAERH